MACAQELPGSKDIWFPSMDQAMYSEQLLGAGWPVEARSQMSQVFVEPQLRFWRPSLSHRILSQGASYPPWVERGLAPGGSWAASEGGWAG